MEMDTGTKFIERQYELIDKRTERWIFDVKRGKFPLRAIMDIGRRTDVEKDMIESYTKGELPKHGVIALLEHQLVMMHIRKRTIDTIPSEIRDLVQRAIDMGITATDKGFDNFDEKVLEYEPG